MMHISHLSILYLSSILHGISAFGLHYGLVPRVESTFEPSYRPRAASILSKRTGEGAHQQPGAPTRNGGSSDIPGGLPAEKAMPCNALTATTGFPCSHPSWIGRCYRHREKLTFYEMDFINYIFRTDYDAAEPLESSRIDICNAWNVQHKRRCEHPPRYSSRCGRHPDQPVWSEDRNWHEYVIQQIGKLEDTESEAKRKVEQAYFWPKLEKHNLASPG